jgi:hypothetical protein
VNNEFGKKRGVKLMEKCPFKSGEIVVYSPTSRGRDLLLMTSLAELQPGKIYKVSEIQEDMYVVVEGFENAVPSGVYWSEFKLSEDSEDKLP